MNNINNVTRIIPEGYSVNEAAEAWFVLHESRGLNPSEELAFRQWVKNPDNAQAYSELEEISQLSLEPEFLIADEKLLRDYLSGSSPKIEIFNDWRKIAAMLFLCLVPSLIGLSYFANSKHSPQTVLIAESFQSPIGDVSKYDLSDGSHLTLNSGTSLNVNFKNSTRSLTLSNGEAVFKVAKDPKRPFTVRAGDFNVTATGTQFLVRKHSTEKISVFVLEGSVDLASSVSGEKILALSAGQIANIMQNDWVVSKLEHSAANLNWMEGKLEFKNARLEDVLIELDRYVPEKIVLLGDSLKDKKLSLSIQIENIPSVISELDSILPVKIFESGSEITIAPNTQ